MVFGMSCVPHGISQPFTRSVNRVNQLQLDSGLRNCRERSPLPICLSGLLPHHHVELAVGLVAEDESNVVVVSVCVDKKGAFKVNTSKSVSTNCHTRVGVQGLQNFRTLIQNHPVRVLLRVAVWVEFYLLKVVEVCDGNSAVVWAVVQKVIRSITIPIFIALVPNSVIWT